VATQNVHYATPDRFPVYDALTCVRTGTRLPDVHPERRLNGTNYLTSPQEMAALFPDDPRACRTPWTIARRCRPALPEKPPNRFPAFPPPGGRAPSPSCGASPTRARGAGTAASPPPSAGAWSTSWR